MKDRQKLLPMLRAFQAGHVTLDVALDYIFCVYDQSKKLHWRSFSLGASVGQLILYIIYYFFIK